MERALGRDRRAPDPKYQQKAPRGDAINGEIDVINGEMDVIKGEIVM